MQELESLSLCGKEKYLPRLNMAIPKPALDEMWTECMIKSLGTCYGFHLREDSVNPSRKSAIHPSLLRSWTCLLNRELVEREYELSLTLHHLQVLLPSFYSWLSYCTVPADSSNRLCWNEVQSIYMLWTLPKWTKISMHQSWLEKKPF